jgi:hypothetical protein
MVSRPLASVSHCQHGQKTMVETPFQGNGSDPKNAKNWRNIALRLTPWGDALRRDPRLGGAGWLPSATPLQSIALKEVARRSPGCFGLNSAEYEDLVKTSIVFRFAPGRSNGRNFNRSRRSYSWCFDLLVAHWCGSIVLLESKKDLLHLTNPHE